MGVGPRRTSHHRRSRGTALILTVVSLMLMAVLGMAYLQSARANRQAKHNVATRGNLDMVIDATLTQIGNVLKEDLLDASGKFFNAGASEDPTNSNAGGGDEPYDYPWTNNQATQTVVTYDGTVVLKTASAAALGGEQDDTWLASTAPKMPTAAIETNWTWPHITNLNGIFLNGVQDGSSTWPAELVVNDLTDPNRTDTNVKFLTSVSNPNALLINGDLVDADGDGIADSRWTWAPVRKVGGVVYVMAVRIIDNSSLINANVALSQVDSSGNYDSTSNGTNAPRWWSPAELDLGNFVYSHAGVTTAITDELKALLSDRIGTTNLPTPWGTATNERHHFWLNGPSMYGNFQSLYKTLTIDDELGLRYRNGLNDGTVTGLESVMPSFLRSGASDEYRYSDVPGVSDGSSSTSDVDRYFEKNPRLWMTAISGAAIYAPPLSASGYASLTRKIDLNRSALNTLSSKIEGVLNAGGTYAVPAVYPAGWTTKELAEQFAVCIKDYADTDNLLTEYNGRYGMEALPAISEVYVQGRYVASATPSATPGEWDIVWNRVGVAGFAIEVRNPFPKPIKLTDVNLWIAGVDWGSLDTLWGQATLGADKVLILYRHSRDTNSGDDKVDAIWSSTDPNITAVEITSQTWPNTAGMITVELRAKDNSNNAMTKPYFAAQTDGMPSLAPPQNNVLSAVDPTGSIDYWQITEVGNGNGLNTLIVKPNEFQRGGNPPKYEDPMPPTIRDGSTFDNLGEANKSNGPADKINLATTPSQILIRDDGGVRQVGELAHIAIIGPDPTNAGNNTTVADMWNNVSDVKAFMLDFASTTLVSTIDDALAVPHAVLMLDRFTTMSPAVDNKDNDGDGIDDNPEEQWVPGTINLNTVPGIEAVDDSNDTHLLQRVLPIQDRVVRRDVIKAILNYRDKAAPFSATGRGINGSYRDNPGIAYIGELMKCVDTSSNERIDVLANGSSYTGDTPSLSSGATDYVVDFLSPSNAADGLADDREEEAMIMRWLSQTCSTRSDIFTAYVVIQGFPADDFSKGAVESRRFYAVFDRSRITNKDDAVRVLGVRELH